MDKLEDSFVAMRLRDRTLDELLRQIFVHPFLKCACTTGLLCNPSCLCSQLPKIITTGFKALQLEYFFTAGAVRII